MKRYIYPFIFISFFAFFFGLSSKIEAYYYNYYPLNTNYYGDTFYRYGGLYNDFNVSYYPSYGYYDYRSTNNYNNYYPYSNYNPYNYAGNYNYNYNYQYDNCCNYNGYYNYNYNNYSYYR